MFTAELDGQPFTTTVGKILCIGRNYAAHAAELNNPLPDQAVLFIKAADAACDLRQPLQIPKDQGSVHHELEIALLMGKSLKHATPEEALDAIAGVGLGLDLTLRDVQAGLKQKGLPWERAKSFDGACQLSPFVSAANVSDWHNLHFSLTRNGQLQQQGHSANMLYPVAQLLSEMSSVFTINPGDVIMTGTPEGVGPLLPGDQLCLTLEDWLSVTSEVSA